jgi:hypothetical protein
MLGTKGNDNEDSAKLVSGEIMIRSLNIEMFEGLRARIVVERREKRDRYQKEARRRTVSVQGPSSKGGKAKDGVSTGTVVKRRKAEGRCQYRDRRRRKGEAKAVVEKMEVVVRSEVLEASTKSSSDRDGEIGTSSGQ